MKTKTSLIVLLSVLIIMCSMIIACSSNDVMLTQVDDNQKSSDSKNVNSALNDPLVIEPLYHYELPDTADTTKVDSTTHPELFK